MNHEYRIGDYIEDRYQVKNILAGGMGKVYVAFDLALDQTVAIKTIPTSFADSHFGPSFLDEAQTWILLEKHPHIVQAKSSFLVQEQPYLVVEYIDGGDLRGLLRNGPLDLRTALRLAIQFCAGAEYAYRKLKLIHRDIKPDNLLLTSNGTLKIADFGLSRIGSEFQSKGVVGGTPPYMPPEQWVDVDTVTKQSDIYSFGVVMYEMFTGQRPFSATDFRDLKKAHAEDIPVAPNTLNPSIPDEISEITLKCLEKNPLNRFLHYEDLAERVKQAYERHTMEKYTETVSLNDAQPQSTAELLNCGDSLFTIGQYSEALRYYDRLLDADPHSAKFWRRKAETLARLGKYHEAELYFSKTLSLEPSNLDAVIGNTKCMIKLGKLQEALTCCSPALAINPNDKELLKLKQKLLPTSTETNQQESSKSQHEGTITTTTNVEDVSFYNTLVTPPPITSIPIKKPPKHSPLAPTEHDSNSDPRLST
jgi:serine/threonine protein kinase